MLFSGNLFIPVLYRIEFDCELGLYSQDLSRCTYMYGIYVRLYTIYTLCVCVYSYVHDVVRCEI